MSASGVVTSTSTIFNPAFKFLTITFVVDSITSPEVFLNELIRRVQPYKSQDSKIGFGINQTASFLPPFYIEFRSSLTGGFILHRLSKRLQSQKNYLNTQLNIVFTINKAVDPRST
jgi:hypothetical protein